MTTGMNTVIYPVRDLAAAKRLFSALLGTPPYVDEPYYVGFRVGAQELGLDPNGHGRGRAGPVGYWGVDDIAATVDVLLDGGAQPQQPISDVGGGKLIASVTDPDGNVIGLLQDPPQGQV